MKFIDRIKVYVIGLSLGSLMVFFFFGNRACGSWLPGNRVKKEILSFPFLSSPRLECTLQENKLTRKNLIDFVKNAKINFSESDVRHQPKKYLLEKDNVSRFFLVDGVDSTCSIEFSSANCDSLNNRFKSGEPLVKK